VRKTVSETKDTVRRTDERERQGRSERHLSWGEEKSIMLLEVSQDTPLFPLIQVT
jgi:hypothetical protein